MKKLIVFLTSLTSLSTFAASQQQSEFFRTLAGHCGKAYRGEIVVDTSPSDSFVGKALIMHVRQCTSETLRIPFHVGGDASRTWVISKTGTGLSLKHDHRHKDGSEDKLTQYGGHTHQPGWPQVQSFPADQYTQEMFVTQGLPQSLGNTWHLFIYPDKFSYRLTREGRAFQVDFDLTQPVEAPPAPWGAKNAVSQSPP